MYELLWYGEVLQKRLKRETTLSIFSIYYLSLFYYRRAEERDKYEKERLRREVDLEQAKREREVRRKNEQADEVSILITYIFSQI